MSTEGRIKGVAVKEYKGVKYRSTLEADTAEVLDLLGLPFKYEKKKIVLLDKFNCPYQKGLVRAITYTPDFTIGPLIIECKGFETPEWKIKKKYVFKYLMDKEPDKMFYQIGKSKRQLLQVLDNHWEELGYVIQIKHKKDRKHPVPEEQFFSSIKDALRYLKLGKTITSAILSVMTGKKDYIYGYEWKLKKIDND